MNTEQKPAEVPSTLLGLYAVIAAPLVLGLYSAATFVVWGWAGRAYHFMIGGF